MELNNTISSPGVSLSQPINHTEKNMIALTSVSVFAYLCVCSLSVGSGGVVFVSEESLQLSNAAAHSGYLDQTGNTVTLIYHLH